jgi:hypothetical protein
VDRKTEEGMPNRMASKGEGERNSDKNDMLPEDLFDDLMLEEEPTEKESTIGDKVATEDEFPEDLFDDLDVADLAADQESRAVEPSALGRKYSEDDAADVELKSEVEREGVNASLLGAPTSVTEELVAVISKRVVAAICALLEEQLPSLVKGIIEEEIK